MRRATEGVNKGRLNEWKVLNLESLNREEGFVERVSIMRGNRELNRERLVERPQ